MKKPSFIWKVSGIAVALVAAAMLALILTDSRESEESRSLVATPEVAMVRAKPQSFTGPKAAKSRVAKVRELAAQDPYQIRESLTHDHRLEDKLLHADALALNGSGEAVGMLLEAIVRERDRGVRRELAEALKNLTDPAGLETLMSATAATNDPAILRQVIEAAGRMATPESIDYLVSLYRAEPTFPGQLRAVAKALSHIENPGAARMLGSLASTATEPGLIEAAAHSLAKIGNATSVQGLLSTLDHLGTSDPGLRHSLLVMLARVNTPGSAAFREAALTETQSPDVLQILQDSL